MITETLHIRGNLSNLGGQVAHMTLQSESHMETLELRTPIVLCYSPDMDSRGKEKERPAKNNLVAQSRKGEV